MTAEHHVQSTSEFVGRTDETKGVPSGHRCVEVRKVPVLGRVLYTTKAFEVGDEIFSEEPIIVSLEAPTESELRIIQRVAEKSGLSLVDDFVFIKSYCLSPLSRREQVLDCYVPASYEVAQSKLLSSLLRVVDVCLLFDWGKPFPKEELQRVLLIKACNAHGFHAQSASSAALYSFGSKLRHSCVPNVIYTSQRRSDGKGSFIARSPIAAGDELFISYIDVFATCPMRAYTLRENYLFKCDCTLCCEAVDWYRGLSCGECGNGFMYRDQKEEIWNCQKCNRVVNDMRLVVEEEQMVERYRSFCLGTSTERLTDLLIHSCSSLGEMHAVTKLLEKKYIESILLPNLSTECLDELIMLTDGGMSWAGDMGFFDSLLVEIACAVAKLGNFEIGLKYFRMLQKDMEITFGKRSNNELVQIVKKGITACEKRNKKLVPELMSSQPQCPVQ